MVGHLVPKAGGRDVAAVEEVVRVLRRRVGRKVLRGCEDVQAGVQASEQAARFWRRVLDQVELLPTKYTEEKTTENT